MKQHIKNTRFARIPEHDRRIRRGDDFAGDAWRDRDTGEIKYVAVGVEPGAVTPRRSMNP